MADIKALKARAEGFRQKLRAIDKITGVESERSRDAARKRRDRVEAKTIFVPPCADLTRRAEMESDDERCRVRHAFRRNQVCSQESLDCRV